VSHQRPPVLDDWSTDPWDGPDELYAFEGERPRHSRQGAKWTGFGILIVGVAVILVAGAAGLWLVRQLDPPGSAGPPVNFTVKAGENLDAVADRLEAAKIISNAAVFKFYVDRKGGLKPQPGYYTLRPRDTMGNILGVLRTPPAQTYDDVLFIEGFTLTQMSQRLRATLPRMKPGAFMKAATDGSVRSKFEPPHVKSLEGLLFPAKYQIAGNDSEAKVVARLAKQMDIVGDDVGLDKLPVDQAYQTLTVASMVEREAKTAADRPLIARVILNRLMFGMPLQIDSTLLYGHDPKTPFEKLKTLDTPYNTYLHTGLPPSPIGNPGRASIRAALNPAPNPATCPTNHSDEPCAWLFYVLAAKDGQHAFATNVRDHDVNVNKARAAGLLGS
jgi:UPF0755 protein